MKLIALIICLLSVSALAQVTNPTSENVPGYEGASVPETGYSHGLMYEDAENRALFGQGQDGQAARVVTDSFTQRPEVVLDDREEWIANAKKGEDTPSDFVTMMTDHYGDCEGGDVENTAKLDAFNYSCTSPATKSRYACRNALAPVCTDVSASCMELVSTDTGIMPFSFDGSRYMYIGKHGANSIPDRRSPTRVNYYTAELTFKADRDDVHRFMLERLDYEDFVEVTFNDIPVFTDLDRAQYTNVATCGGCHVINRPVSRNLNFDLRPYLKTGLNTFRVRLTAVAHGQLWLKLDTDSRCCKSWSDIWQESCK